MRFGQDFIEKVQEANNLVDLISQYTQLKPASGGYMGKCPFPDHQEKTASFSVSEAKQVYNCFGCGKKGNIFTFLRDYNGMSFREALEYLANRANIPIPEEPNQDTQAQDLLSQKKKQLMLANKLAAQYYHESLLTLSRQHPARIYAEKRGLTEETIRKFQIGYAPEEWDGLTQFLRSKNIAMSLAEEARLVKAKKEGNGYFDLFRDRLMFPILNAMGEPIAFGGRIILQGEPKYLNSPETPVFTKGKVLYGLSQAARHIRSEDVVLVVEGYMDVVSLAQQGVETAVATMGTSLTPDHAKTLGRMTKNVVALFDGDQAGLAAAERALPILLAAELHPKGLVLPDGMDPDDFVKIKGTEALKQLLERAPDLFSLILGLWTENFRGEASEKVQLWDRLAPIFAAMRDGRIRSLYFKEVQTKLGVEDRWLSQALSPQQGARAVFAAPVHKPEAISLSEQKLQKEQKETQSKQESEWHDRMVGGVIRLQNAPKAELMLIGLALKNRAYVEELVEQNLAQYLSHAGVSQLLEKIIEQARQAPQKFDKLTGLLATLVDKPEDLIAAGDFINLRLEKSSVQTTLMDDPQLQQQKENELFRDCLRKVKDLSMQNEVVRIQQQMKSGVASEEASVLMERLMRIQRDRMNLQNEMKTK